MNELALFAGAGGGILGGHLLGWRTVCAVERDAFAAAVLAQRQNDGHLDPFPIWSDIETFDGRPWRGFIDVVSGGFPCQDISCAGKGIGITGYRSGLWKEMSRVVREVGPHYIIVENSPMLTNRGIGIILSDMAEMGFNAKWGVLGACDAGLSIQRDRLWIIASAINKPGKIIHRRAYKKQRNLGFNRSFRSQVDRFMEELEGQGEQRENQGKNCVPSYLCRVGNGLAIELDELRAIGNGQVPAVVRLAWETLSGQQ